MSIYTVRWKNRINDDLLYNFYYYYRDVSNIDVAVKHCFRLLERNKNLLELKIYKWDKWNKWDYVDTTRIIFDTKEQIGFEDVYFHRLVKAWKKYIGGKVEEE